MLQSVANATAITAANTANTVFMVGVRVRPIRNNQYINKYIYTSIIINKYINKYIYTSIIINKYINKYIYTSIIINKYINKYIYTSIIINKYIYTSIIINKFNPGKVCLFELSMYFDKAKYSRYIFIYNHYHMIS